MQAEPECYADRDALQPAQLQEDASKLIATIEESQFGFQHSLQGPYGPRRGELSVLYVLQGAREVCAPGSYRVSDNQNALNSIVSYIGM